MAARKLTPLRAIREKCIDCCAGSKLEVKKCPATSCPLNSMRFGKYPKKSSYFMKGKTERQEVLGGDE